MRFILAFSALTFLVAAEPAWSPDGKAYKIVCDPTATAKFASANGVPRAKCAYLELAKWKYIQAVENPCDETATGRELREFLGAACEKAKMLGLSAGDQIYTRFQRCGTEAQSRGLASYSCEEKFESQ